MNIDINNIVRSVLITIAVAPLTFTLAGQISANTEVAKTAEIKSEAQTVIDAHLDALTKACIDFRLSKVDTKLERTAKNTIDEYFDGEVNYNNTCNWVLG